MRRRPSGSVTEDEGNSPGQETSSSEPENDNDSPCRSSVELLNGTRQLSYKESKSQEKLQSDAAWKLPSASNTSSKKVQAQEKVLSEQTEEDTMERNQAQQRKWTRWRNPWSISVPTLATLAAAALLLCAIWQSFVTRQLDPKGAGMSRMASSYVHFAGFDTEHTRFATKYNLYLYRELGIDEDPRVSKLLHRHDTCGH